MVNNEETNFFMVSFGTLGDFLMQLSLFECINICNPHISIYVLAIKNQRMLEDLAKAYPYISFITLDQKHLLKSIQFIITSFFKNNIFFIPPTFAPVGSKIKIIGKLVTWWSRDSKLVGFYDGTKISRIYDNVLTFDVQILFYKNLYKVLPILNCKASDEKPHYHWCKNNIFLNKTGIKSPYIVINPFAGSKRRSLPMDRWSDLVFFLEKKYQDYEIVIVGSPHDCEDAENLVSSDKIHNLCGSIPLSQIAAFIDGSSLFIGVDSGLTHLASLIETPSVIIGNLSNPTWLPSYSQHTTILYEKSRCVCNGDKTGDCFEYVNGVPYYRCMLDIPQERIKETITQCLEN